MEVISYHHNLDDCIVVRLGTMMQSAVQITDIQHLLKVVDGIVAVQPNPDTDELLIMFDKEKIDANSLLHLLGYSGSFIWSERSLNGAEAQLV
jgi:hypothetical protein